MSHLGHVEGEQPQLGDFPWLCRGDVSFREVVICVGDLKDLARDLRDCNDTSIKETVGGMGYFMFVCLTCDISMSQTFELEMLHWVKKCKYILT